MAIQLGSYLDNGDGTYALGYKPITSGRYTIAISLCGEPLNGSPFTAFVTTPTPSAPHCILRGATLTQAMARKEEPATRTCDVGVPAGSAGLVANFARPQLEKRMS